VPGFHNEPVTGDVRDSLWFHRGTTAYEARYTMLSSIAVGPPVMLGFAVWFVYAIVTALQREPFPADPRPSDFFYYSLFVGLLGGCAAWFTAMSVGWLLAGATRRVAMRVAQGSDLLVPGEKPPADFYLTIRGWDLDMEGLITAQRTFQPVVQIVILDEM